jgi:UDP-2-acetamido-2-deoxy-ribo-hexuluronate aminotransferase
MNFIDLNLQYKRIKNEIDSAIKSVIDKGDFIQGGKVKLLEEKLESFVGSRCVTCSDGTDALFVALKALNVKPGDEVIVPSFTWVSTAEVVKLVGAEPIFADINADSFNITLEHIEPKITKKTKAIIPVSMFGRACDILEITNYANEKGIYVIEDSAQAFGSKNEGKMSCSVADISTTSFFPAKPLGCYGDGGAIFTNNEDLYTKINAITKHGQKGRYNYVEIGLNSRLDTLQASILIEKLKIYEDEIALRNKIAKKYDSFLSKNSFFKTPVITDQNNRSVWAQYTILLDSRISDGRSRIMEDLKERGIPTALYYPAPLHLQGPYMKGENEVLKITENISKRVLSLPMHPYLTTEQIEQISSELIDVVEKY